MDLPPWVNQAATSSDEPGDETTRRLAAIENSLAALGERLDTLSTSLESSVREAVAKDVETIATDLRHTVSDLGRLLVRDLGRLNKILSEHRDTIVAEVRGRPAGAAAEPPTVAEPSPLPAGDTSSAGAAIPVADGADEAPPSAGAGWRNRRRRDS